MELIFSLLILAPFAFLLGYFFANKRQKWNQNPFQKELTDVKGALDETAIVAITDSRGQILEVNDKFCEISKYSREELIGQDHRILNSGFHEKDFFRNMWATIAKGESWQAEVKNKAKDGSYYWVDTKVVPFLDENGKPEKFIAIRFDITSRKYTEEQLKQSGKEKEDLIKNLADIYNALDEAAIVAITNEKGIIEKVNDKFCELSKYSPNELIGKDHKILNSGYHGKEFFKNMWATIGRGYIWRGEVKNRAKDGTYYWVDTHIIPLLDSKGKPFKYVAIRFDITQKVAMEEELRNALGDIEKYTKVFSHDLKTPLRGISTLTEFIKDDLGEDVEEDVVKNLDLIKTRTHSISSLVNGLLQFSEVNLEEKDVQFDSDETIKRLSKKFDASIEISGEWPVIRSKKMKFKQVIGRLIDNALKFNSSETKEVTVGVKEKVFEYEFFVKDNGPGIDPVYHDKIFELFQRLDDWDGKSSRGIGLTITKKLVKQLGGEIWVESDGKTGSTFKFTIPKRS